MNDCSHDCLKWGFGLKSDASVEHFRFLQSALSDAGHFLVLAKCAPPEAIARIMRRLPVLDTTTREARVTFSIGKSDAHSGF